MQTLKYSEAEAAMKAVIKILNRGGLVVFPCETVYGIAADCMNPAAIKKLSTYKQRPLGKPYAIMVSDQKMAEGYVHLNETARQLYAKFLPGPLTVVSQSKHKTAVGVESETGTVGVRIPDYKFMRTLIAKFGRPIAATSANASYQKRPYKLEDIWDNISEKQRSLVDLTIDAGELPRNEPSTVVDTTSEELVVLRQGDVKLKDQVEVMTRSESETQNLGKELWQKYEKHAGQRAVVFALEGLMGVGKTQIAKGIAKAMGINETIVSPTYILEAEYEKGLVHIDTWRMQDPTELESLGFGKRVNDKSILIVEWADKAAEIIRSYSPEAVVVWVKLNYGDDENERRISWGVL